MFGSPWPGDHRLTDGSAPDLSAFPNPGQRSPIDEYVRVVAEHWPGFGTMSSFVLPFAGAPERAVLPQPADTLNPVGSRIALVNIDPKHPRFGRLLPLELSWRPFGDRWHPAGSLLARSVDGFPMDGGVPHALVIWDGFGGWSIDESPWWKTQIAGEAGQGLRQLIAAGRLPAQPRAGTLVTPQDPVAELAAAADVLDEDPRGTVDLTWADAGQRGRCRVAAITLEVPVFQHGTPPYTREGGDWRLGPDRRPRIARREEVGALLTVPDGVTMPTDGWPTVLYAHGTGGSHRSVLGIADDLCGVGLAALGFDQPLHGLRWPVGGRGDPTILTFNIFNLQAARDNLRQGAADLVTIGAWLRALDHPLPWGGRFVSDPKRYLFMGHSQGSSTGVPYLAVRGERHVGAVLSGASGGLVLALLEKVEPLPIPLMFELGVGAEGEYDGFHPIPNLLQTFAESADALPYGRYLLREGYGDRPSWRPLHLYVSEGLSDAYTPPALLEALATTLGVEPVAPLLQTIPALELDRRTIRQRPVGGNWPTTDGEPRTAVLVQYDSGHFSLFDQPEGTREFVDFLAAAGRLETPLLRAR